MAIAKTKKFELITLTENLDSTLKKLQKLKLVQIEKGTDSKESSTTETSKIQLEIDKLLTAQRIAAKFSTSEKNSAPPPQNLRDMIIDADKRITLLLNDNKALAQEIKSIIPYSGSPYPLKKTKTAFTVSRHGYITGEIPNGLPGVFIQILRNDNNKAYVWLLQKNDSEAIPGFTDFIKDTDLTPSEQIDKLSSQINKNNKKINSLENTLAKLSSHSHIFQMRRLLKKKELAEEKEKLFTTEKVSVISGYILSEQTKKLSKEFPEAYISFSEAGDDAPVAFENNPIVSPVEGITESYTMPSGTDIDPNPVMAFFYYLFFGMMFSDAGYGLMMMLVCGYFGFFGKSKIKKMFRMFFFCGISTLFWGLMYGSFFGNAITSIGEIFFNRRLILRPLWINPTAEPLKLLIFSIALGFIQIITGLTIKLFIQVKNGRIREGIYDTGSWIVTLLGLGIVSAGIGFSPLKAPGAIITLIGVIMLITTQGREKKNIFLKISGGILSLYNITSYISDILSYSRLMALGLATGVIAEVVNILGGLGGNSPAGIIMYCGIFIVGHGLNFAINMLGAYVHTNRLQYVEFYSKFYEGGGKAFIPFGSRY